MASSLLLRPAAAVRVLLLTLPRLTAQSACVTRPLCRVPPDSSEQNGNAKAAATATNDENKEKLLDSENVETQAEDHKPLQETEGKKDGKSELHDLKKQESSVKENAAVGKQEKSSDRKKLHDLLASLASVDPISVAPYVQLSHPKARKRKATPPGTSTSPPVLETGLDPELVSATKEVAESLGGDVKETESELLSTLRQHSSEDTTTTTTTTTPTTTTPTPTPSISELFVGMKVERKPRSEEVPRRLPNDTEVGHPHRLLPRDKHLPHRSLTQPRASSAPRIHVDLFGGQPLGIFKKRQENTSEPPAAAMSLLPTWERLHQHELQQSMLHPPSNTLVEMIQWTNEGKLWTFPIDNETGLEEEKQVGFHEHIFLERHLEAWCPQRGPIRHFMELVCTGLSKNPHLTVQRKQAHIEWYKNYFSQKEELLKELGAIEVSQQQ